MHKELKLLQQLKQKENAVGVIYGRRRIGKSSLIREFLKGKGALYFEGLEGLPKRQQPLRNATITQRGISSLIKNK